MPFLTQTSIKFVAFNALRALSVVAILLALAGSITTLVTDMEGYAKYQKADASASASSTSSARLRARELDVGVGVVGAHRMMRKKREYIDPASQYSALGHTTYYPHSTASATSSSSSAKATAAKSTATLAASSSSATAVSNYIDGTSVPKATGGVVFVALNRIFVCKQNFPG